MTNTTGLATVKYIYGPATVNTDHDSVIGSSLQGRIESRIGLPRLTTIIMPMKGKLLVYIVCAGILCTVKSLCLNR
jgi:hypothetical protein